jgi:hypothetical protein
MVSSGMSCHVALVRTDLVFLRSVRRLLVAACHPDEGGARFLRNVGSYKNHTAQQPRRHHSSRSVPCSQEPSTHPYPEPDQSSPHHCSQFLLRLNSTLSNHQPLNFPTGLFPFCFPTNILYVYLFSSIHSTCPIHLTPFA